MTEETGLLRTLAEDLSVVVARDPSLTSRRGAHPTAVQPV